MANESLRGDAPHDLRLENRARLSVTGVREVESFDEESVVLHTAKGVLVIRGQSLHLQTLSRSRAASFPDCFAEWSSRCGCRGAAFCWLP